MKNTSMTGRLGEDIACAYLENKGFDIVERNFRRPWGELDIVARAKDRTLVFVEVKTSRTSALIGIRAGDSCSDFNSGLGISPEDNMNAAKLRKTRKIASAYANDNPGMIDESVGWRIDLIAISISGSTDMALTDLIKNCEIKHFENVE